MGSSVTDYVWESAGRGQRLGSVLGRNPAERFLFDPPVLKGVPEFLQESEFGMASDKGFESGALAVAERLVWKGRDSGMVVKPVKRNAPADLFGDAVSVEIGVSKMDGMGARVVEVG